jgi:hypothetical protein
MVEHYDFTEDGPRTIEKITLEEALKLRGETTPFRCKAEESRWQDASACKDCQNKCDEYHQWDKEMKMSDNSLRISLEKLDEDAKETVRNLIECYEDNCFTKDERITLAGLALKARLRYQLNKHKDNKGKRMTKEGFIDDLLVKLRNNIQLDDLEIYTIDRALHESSHCFQEPYYEGIYHDEYGNKESRIMNSVSVKTLEEIP